ncbi:MAG: hypothetical protein C6Y20_10585 [Tagaea sp. CACIAM 22H2]|nr:hypothetical protein [Tagaea sp. CACIAM 22H2]
MTNPRKEFPFAAQIAIVLAATVAALIVLHFGLATIDAYRVAPVEPQAGDIPKGDAWQALANLIGTGSAGLLAVFVGLWIHLRERQERERRAAEDDRRRQAEIDATAAAFDYWLKGVLSGFVITLDMIWNCARNKLDPLRVAFAAQHDGERYRLVTMSPELRQRLAEHHAHSLTPLDDFLRGIQKLGDFLPKGTVTVTVAPNINRLALDPTPDWAHGAVLSVTNTLTALRQIALSTPEVAPTILAYDQLISGKADIIKNWSIDAGATIMDFSDVLLGKPANASANT